MFVDFQKSWSANLAMLDLDNKSLMIEYSRQNTGKLYEHLAMESKFILLQQFGSGFTTFLVKAEEKTKGRRQKRKDSPVCRLSMPLL